MKKIKQLFVFVLLFGLLFSELQGVKIANAVETNKIITGKCGESVYYELNRTTGLLRIYGFGAMEDYRYKYDLEGHVTELENQAPWIEQGYSTDITKVVIEKGVTYIGSSSFSSKRYAEADVCTNIQTVDIAETVTEIGSNAFKECENLTTISIPNQVETIGSFAFDCCPLYSIQWGNSIQKIGCFSFENTNFTKLDIPQQIQYIGWGAFAACRVLESVTVSDECEIGYEAFSYCDSLENFTIGENCKIHGRVFYNCSSLTEIAVGEGSIGIRDIHNDSDYGVFEGCKSLQSISLPDSWEFENEKNGLNAYTRQFDGCTNLKEIFFSNTNIKYKSINNVVFSKNEKELIYYPAGLTATEYEIPSNVKTISISAFDGQKFLENVIIPEGIIIESRAFQGCEKLNNVIIPEGVAELTVRVFANCDSLKTIVLPKSLKTIDLNGKASTATFDHTDLEVVYCEKGSYSANWAAEKYRETIYCFFDANGGSVDIEKKPVIYGDKYHKLPIPKKEGYKFLGWYTKKETGVQISSEIAVSKETSHTLYAHWEIDSTTKKSIGETTVTLGLTNYTYDGTEKKPSVTVKDGTILLVGGTDYLVSYSNNVNVGTATVTITGKGNYTGTVTKTFTINAKIVEKKPFVWGDSNWNFDNSSRYFSNYDVNSDVMDKMKKDFNLGNSDIVELKWNIANHNKSGFSGSCFGMTISEILAHQGDIKLSRYGGNDIVNKNANTSNMTSVINFIQELQSNSEMCQSIRQTPFLKGDYSQEEFVSKLNDVATNSNYLVKLSYKIVTKNINNGSTINGYHAVLVYGIEKCNYYSSVTGKTQCH